MLLKKGMLRNQTENAASSNDVFNIIFQPDKERWLRKVRCNFQVFILIDFFNASETHELFLYASEIQK